MLNLHRKAQPLRYSRLALAMCIAWPPFVFSQTNTASQPSAGSVAKPVAALKPIIVSGARSERLEQDTPASVEVTSREQMDAQQVRDIRDLVQTMPNVSVRRAPARFSLAGTNTGREGNAGFNIRGLEGNRVLILTDGIREPKSYAFGSNSFGRDYQDLALLKRVEIIKGPASALYGSDGLAGMVNFITLQPDDFLTQGKTFGGRAGLSYSADDDSLGLAASLAGRGSEAISWMVNLQTSRAKALDNQGSNDAANIDRTTPNPQKDNNRAVLGKLVITPGGGARHTITLQHAENTSDYELLSTRAKTPLTGSPTAIANAVLRTDANAKQSRDRLSWEGRWPLKADLADSLQAHLSLQNADSRSVVREDRNTSADRVRDTLYQESTRQLGLQAEKTLRMGSDAVQKITYGFDHVQSRVENLNTGVTPPAGETFPLKRFPDTRESSSALYAQSDISFGNWTLSPALRWDRFSIRASQAGFSPPSITPAASLSGSAVSPKFGALFQLDPAWSLYGNFASGFKAPDAGQINAFFENITSFYKTIPNPNLKPEKSRNIELGARARMDKLSLDAALFRSSYQDLIEESRRVGGTGVAGNPTIFQSVNIGKATIHGFEFKAQYEWARGAGGAWSSSLSYGKTRGKDDITGTPINSIEPAKLSAGLGYKTATWDVQLRATHHSAKKADETNGPIQVAAATFVPQFLTPSATTLDLQGQWRLNKDMRLNFAIHNLTDKKYWLWSSSRAQAANATTLDAFTQPGRHLKVSFITDF
jgi:hemoglobin/transferrin/lactoferrin receptor protein